MKLDENYEEKIEVFKSKYKILKINPTLKVHLIDHVKDFLDRKVKQGYPRTGLGFFSEQTFESAHKKWKDFWARYKVNRDHENYNEMLEKTVHKFNNDHM